MKAQLPRPQWIEPDEVVVTSTPGIVVHRLDEARDWDRDALGARWFVVHEASGQRLAAWKRPEPGDVWGRPLTLAYDDRAQAVTVAEALGGLADWTADAERLHAAVGPDVIELLYRIGDAAEGVTA